MSFLPQLRTSLWSLAFFALAACTGNAGVWSTVPWKSDADLPKFTPEAATHAISFGIDATPPPPAPFVITKKISGENWAVWKAPEHTQELAVSRRPDELLSTKSVSAKGAGAALIRGRLMSKTKTGWLTLELTGLTPGAKYNLAVFGLVVFSTGPTKIEAIASDAPDKPESLPQSGSDSHYFLYEYIAPPDGTLSITFTGDETNPDIRVMRLCAFLNVTAK